MSTECGQKLLRCLLASCQAWLQSNACVADHVTRLAPALQGAPFLVGLRMQQVEVSPIWQSQCRPLLLSAAQDLLQGVLLLLQVLLQALDLLPCCLLHRLHDAPYASSCAARWVVHATACEGMWRMQIVIYISTSAALRPGEWCCDATWARCICRDVQAAVTGRNAP